MKLNEFQSDATRHVDGPLLIIAGAGTGKTRVITSRVLFLLKDKGIKAQNILALTFTEKAAAEMLDRIDEQLPLGYEELNVKTFHAFCDQILRESGLEMGVDPGYKILTQIDQWFFFKNNLFEFDLDYYRPLGNPNRFIYALLNHFSKLKDEMITPESYLDYAQGLEAEDADKVRELARVYKQYQDLLIKNNYLDFGDLTYYAIKLLEKRESVRKYYSQKFSYVMVDEFQDTNFAQFKLLLLLCKDHSNVVVVGDDDQSIYKWRGASLSNIIKFEETFPDCKKVVLTENYRSSANILDASYSLITNNNPDRLEVKFGINKKLRCNLEGNSEVEVHQFPYFMQEASFVADKIKELAEEGSKYSEIAILLRSNQLAVPFIDELKFKGIPYQVRSPKGLLALDEIKDLLAVLRVLVNQQDDVSWLRVFKMPFFAISMEEILKCLNNPKKDGLYEAIRNDSQMLPGTEQGVDKVFKVFEHLIEFSRDASVGLVLNEFLSKSGYLEYLIEKEEFESLDNINQFAKQVSRFEKEHESKMTWDFVNYLELLEEANAVFAEESHPDRDAVQILTVHSSKGLEFDHVFITNTVKHRFPTIRRRDPFEVPEVLTQEIYPEGDFHIQEERRLFYVAMTRAKKDLFITFSDFYEGKKHWKVSPFVEEISSEAGVRTFKHEDEVDVVKKLQEFKSEKKMPWELPEFNKKRLSYSQFDTFQTCPLKYNYRYLLKVPTPTAHAANFGSTIHETLNQFYILLKKGENLDLKVLEDLYEKNWVPYGYENKEHELKRKEKGWEMLKKYYEVNSDPWIVPAFLERNFNLKVADVWVSGRVDRIDRLEDGSYEVIDYKTGGKMSESALRKDLQLSLYALAVRDVFKLNVSKLSLYYMEDNEKLSTSRSDTDLEMVDAKVKDLISKMEDSDFKPTPGFYCSFCDFRLICPAV